MIILNAFVTSSPQVVTVSPARLTELTLASFVRLNAALVSQSTFTTEVVSALFLLNRQRNHSHTLLFLREEIRQRLNNEGRARLSERLQPHRDVMFVGDLNFLLHFFAFVSINFLDNISWTCLIKDLGSFRKWFMNSATTIEHLSSFSFLDFVVLGSNWYCYMVID